MLFEDCHALCLRHRGRAVEIVTHDGMVHRGIITDVDYQMVYLQPLGYGTNLGGFGYGWYGRWGLGFGAGVALGSIATLALLPLFVI